MLVMPGDSQSHQTERLHPFWTSSQMIQQKWEDVPSSKVIQKWISLKMAHSMLFPSCQHMGKWWVTITTNQWIPGPDFLRKCPAPPGLGQFQGWTTPSSHQDFGFSLVHVIEPMPLPHKKWLNYSHGKSQIAMIHGNWSVRGWSIARLGQWPCCFPPLIKEREKDMTFMIFHHSSWFMIHHHSWSIPVYKAWLCGSY